MSRIEDCDAAIKEANEVINSIGDKCDELYFRVQPGEYIMTCIELAKFSMLRDIAQSLAVIADNCQPSNKKQKGKTE